MPEELVAAGPLPPATRAMIRATWPTPTQAPDSKNLGSNQVNSPPCLGDAAREAVALWPPELASLGDWPTPCATDFKVASQPGQRRGQLSEAAEQLWPTPTAGDAKAGSQAHLGVSLTDAVTMGDSRGRRDPETPPGGASTSPAGRVLSPRFVEALMGWPDNWTRTCGRE